MKARCTGNRNTFTCILFTEQSERVEKRAGGLDVRALTLSPLGLVHIPRVRFISCQELLGISTELRQNIGEQTILLVKRQRLEN